MELKITQRGFSYYDFKDSKGVKCSLQQSSSAMENAIWLGVDDVNPQIMCSTAINMGIRERTYTEADNGFCPYPLPEGVVFDDRMHLTQDQVRDLLPILTKFAETGEL